jgi:hypothetical protein
MWGANWIGCTSRVLGHDDPRSKVRETRGQRIRCTGIDFRERGEELNFSAGEEIAEIGFRRAQINDFVSVRLF